MQARSMLCGTWLSSSAAGALLGPLDGGAGYTQQRMQRMMLGIRGHLGPCCDNVLQCEAAIMGLAQVRHNCEALGVHS